MPLSVNEKNDTAHLLVWHLTEDLTFFAAQCSLSDRENNGYKVIVNEGRKREYLCTRYMLREHANIDAPISYENSGRPFLLNCDWNISVSHCKSHLAILLTKESNPGLDIEIISERAIKVSSKFIGVKEKTYFDCTDAKTMTLLWSAKEAMFKALTDVAIDFKSELKVEPFRLSDVGTLEGCFVRNGINRKIALRYRFMEGCVIVWGNHH